MKVLGIESSCDETGVALVDAAGEGVPQLLAQALHSQVDMHQAYGGVVPELASRDHIRRVLPLTRQVLADAGCSAARTSTWWPTPAGPGLAGALLVGAGVAVALAAALGRPTLGVHHLEGHLLSPFLSADPPQFPFVALLVSGGHTQLMRVDGVGRYALLGETIDDAAGEAFDKSAKLLGLGYPGGPALSRAGRHGRADAFVLPRPLLHRPNLDFSFAGLKTAVAVRLAQAGRHAQRRSNVPTWRPACRPPSSTCCARSRCARCRPAACSAWWWPAAWAPMPACASGWTRPAAASARACTIRSWRCAPTTAR